MKRAHCAIAGACSWLAGRAGALSIGLAVVWMASLPSPAWGQWTGGPTGPIYYNGVNAGIGTASPAYGLDVTGYGAPAFIRANATSGDSAILLGLGGVNKFKVYRDTTGQYVFGSTMDAYPLALGVNNSINMWLANGGNVGIGTTNP